MSRPKSHVAAMRYESQVKVRMQQQKKLRKRRHRGGASAATHCRCAWLAFVVRGIGGDGRGNIRGTVHLLWETYGLVSDNDDCGWRRAYFRIFSARLM